MQGKEIGLRGNKTTNYTRIQIGVFLVWLKGVNTNGIHHDPAAGIASLIRACPPPESRGAAFVGDYGYKPESPALLR